MVVSGLHRQRSGRHARRVHVNENPRGHRHACSRESGMCVRVQSVPRARSFTVETDANAVPTAAEREVDEVLGRGEEKEGSRRRTRRVAVLGGTGRVGSETARALVESYANMAAGKPGTRERSGSNGTASSNAVAAQEERIEIVLVGRDEARADAARTRWPGALGNAEFKRCDIDDVNFVGLVDMLGGCDLVVNAAGPFQRRAHHNPLRAAIEAGVPYMDVCDDLDYSIASKSGSHADAVERGVPALVCTGIYPGVSNLLAAKTVRDARRAAREAASDEGGMEGGATDDSATIDSDFDVQKLLYSYFTAGSGGVGTTILATTYLLLGEPAATYVDGELVHKPPFSSRAVMDFGDRTGLREVFLCNLPEVESTHRYLGVPSVEARFGTDPGVYNTIMSAMSRLLPRSFLEKQQNARALAEVSMPLVKLTDLMSGEAVAMRIDAKLGNGKVVSSLFSHKRCSVAVGNSTASFARSILDGRVNPGVWFPEEESAFIDYDADADAILSRASKGCRKFLVSQAPWQVDSKPRQVGMGMYLE